MNPDAKASGASGVTSICWIVTPQRMTALQLLGVGALCPLPPAESLEVLVDIEALVLHSCLSWCQREQCLFVLALRPTSEAWPSLSTRLGLR